MKTTETHFERQNIIMGQTQNWAVNIWNCRNTDKWTLLSKLSKKVAVRFRLNFTKICAATCVTDIDNGPNLMLEKIMSSVLFIEMYVDNKP